MPLPKLTSLAVSCEETTIKVGGDTMAGLSVRGYIGFLRRLLYGFVEDDPLRRRTRRRRARKPRLRRVKIRRSPGPQFRIRRRKVPHNKSILVGGEFEYLESDGTWKKYNNIRTFEPTGYASLDHTQDYKNPGPPYITGHNFTSLKVQFCLNPVIGNGVFRTNSPQFVPGKGFKHLRYRGGFFEPDFTGVDFSPQQYADEKFLLGPVSGFVPTMAPYHTLVDARLRPKLSHADLGQTLAEIREIPRMLKGSSRDFRDYWRFLGGSSSSSRMSPKGISDTFLSAQFGWVPFIRDMVAVSELVTDYDRFVRDRTSRNSRWDHRERVLLETTTDNVVLSGSGSRVGSIPFLGDMIRSGSSWGQRFSIREVVNLKVWASGDYKFYRPEFDMSRKDYDSGWSRMSRLSTLLGTNISPSLLWNITPWTWLADWFGNIGSVVDRLSAAGQDGVVSKNVFLMVRRRRELVLVQEFDFIDGPAAFAFQRTVETKQRGHALTPYNFGLTPNQLSGRQLTILAALGISRYL